MALFIISSTVSLLTSADAGGGIRTTGAATIVNSTISGNTSAFNGDGILNNGGGILTLQNCTVTGNRGDSTGANPGLPEAGGISASASETLHDTLVAGNVRGLSPSTTPSDIDNGTIDSANNCLIGDAGTAGGVVNGANGNIVGNNGSGTIDITTVLNTTLANYGGPTQTHLLVFTSPAIDAGTDWTLSANITNTDTTVPVADATAIDWLIRIDTEQMVVTNKAANSLTVTRGVGATSHNSGAAVNAAFDQRGFSRRLDGPDDPDTTATVDIGAVEAAEVTATGGTPGAPQIAQPLPIL